MKRLSPTKECITCKKDKSVSAFHKSSTSKDGLQSQCKECKKAWRREHESKPSTQKRLKNYSAEYRAKNKERLRQYEYEYHRSFSGRYAIYKKSARNRNIDFSLSKEEFKAYWQKPCSYCGDEIETIGLDRVDSTKGYEINNVVSCCEWCNKSKLDRPLAEFIERCKKVAERYKDED